MVRSIMMYNTDTYKQRCSDKLLHPRICTFSKLFYSVFTLFLLGWFQNIVRFKFMLSQTCWLKLDKFHICLSYATEKWRKTVLAFEAMPYYEVSLGFYYQVRCDSPLSLESWKSGALLWCVGVAVWGYIMMNVAVQLGLVILAGCCCCSPGILGPCLAMLEF